MSDEPEDHTLRLLRDLRASVERIERKVDRVEAELRDARDRESARNIDMNRLDRSDTRRSDRMRDIEDRLDQLERKAAEG